jgi:hypothetical protein
MPASDSTGDAKEQKPESTRTGAILRPFFSARQLPPALNFYITSGDNLVIGLKDGKATRILPVYKPTTSPTTSR